MNKTASVTIMLTRPDELSYKYIIIFVIRVYSLELTNAV